VWWPGAVNLEPGWIGFDYPPASEAPRRWSNDAAIKALGSTRAARCCFSGSVPAGDGSLVAGVVEPMELGIMPFEGDVSGLRRRARDGASGKKKWRGGGSRDVDRLAGALAPGLRS